MNDPNGLFYDPVHKKYHLFFQYQTPRTWGHAVSDDMFSSWTNLPIAIQNNEIYNSGGVYSGSVTRVQNDKNDNFDLYLLYSVSTNDLQCLAQPTNKNDPYLINWKNYKSNCVIDSNSDNVNVGRDPTTGMYNPISQEYTFISLSYPKKN